MEQIAHSYDAESERDHRNDIPGWHRCERGEAILVLERGKLVAIPRQCRAQAGREQINEAGDHCCRDRRQVADERFYPDVLAATGSNHGADQRDPQHQRPNGVIAPADTAVEAITQNDLRAGESDHCEQEARKRYLFEAREPAQNVLHCAFR